MQNTVSWLLRSIYGWEFSQYTHHWQLGCQPISLHKPYSDLDNPCDCGGPRTIFFMGRLAWFFTAEVKLNHCYHDAIRKYIKSPKQN